MSTSEILTLGREGTFLKGLYNESILYLKPTNLYYLIECMLIISVN